MRLELWNSARDLVLDIGVLIIHGPEGTKGISYRAENAAPLFVDEIGAALLHLAVSAFAAAVTLLKQATSAIIAVLAHFPQAITQIPRRWGLLPSTRF